MAHVNMEKRKQYYLSFNLKTCGRAKIPKAAEPIDFYGYDVATDEEIYHSSIAGPLWVDHNMDLAVWNQIMARLGEIVEYL